MNFEFLPLIHSVGAMWLVLALMIVFWMTEALPLAVTALMGPTLCVILGVASAQVAVWSAADSSLTSMCRALS